jgi:DNA modification methylase
LRFHGGAVELIHGECVAAMRGLDDASVDAIVTDPPYGIGLRGRKWDRTGIAVSVEMWRECLRVLKPGAHVAAFAATRTYHRMACAIEDAGFECRDMIAWTYGQGFPKSRHALKPALEPICLARKRGRSEGLNIEACRIGWAGDKARSILRKGDRGGILLGLKPQAFVPAPGGRWPANLVLDGSAEALTVFSDSSAAARFFYCAKAGPTDRLGSKHPTVKPVSLIRWLARLIARPGGLVLDPFAGTGTTGEAAVLEGMRALLIEREDEHAEDIAIRMANVHASPADRRDLHRRRASDERQIGPLVRG